MTATANQNVQEAVNPAADRVVAAREYQGGVIAIDTGQVRTELAACYLLEAGSAAALVECGTNKSVPGILEVLRHRGWKRDQVSHVIVTHVHLDHAGGAGRLMREFPQATLVVHSRGARHMADPAKLEAGSRAVFGDEAYDDWYGSLVPVPQERMHVVADGETLSVGDRELLFIDTEGHARHHFCVWDRHTRGWFTGDTFGVSYRQLDTAAGHFIYPTTTPTQFDPDALIASVERLMSYEPEYLYLTHYGRVKASRRLADDMIAGVRLLAGIAEKHAASRRRTDDIESEILAHWMAAAREHGVVLPDQELRDTLAHDAELNTQGLEYWLDHRAA